MLMHRPRVREASVGECRPQTRHHSLALYVLLRGVTLLVRCGNKRDAPPAVHALLAPTRWRHGDTGLMCLCTCQVAHRNK